jgi:REP element-mobilizing transposase RayT
MLRSLRREATNPTNQVSTITTPDARGSTRAIVAGQRPVARWAQTITIMPDAFTALFYHLVFSTKYRYPWITEAIAADLYRCIGVALKRYDGILLAAGGMPDHVHLLVVLSRRRSVSDALCIIKANSSAWVHRTFDELGDFAWQVGYGAFSVDRSSISRVKRYIARQREHHTEVSFQKEFIGLLRTHDVPYDERYLWD